MRGRCKTEFDGKVEGHNLCVQSDGSIFTKTNSNTKIPLS